MFPFTKCKFLAFSYEQQHKKCAIKLRQIYDFIGQNHLHTSLQDEYNQMVEWMQIDKIKTWSLESISNAYHDHLNASKTYVHEDNYLISHCDKEEAAPIWPIAIYLDNLRSAHNIGSILRTTEAFSLGKIYFSEKTPFIDHKQVQKTSMKSYQYIEAEKISTISHLPKPIIALETSENGISLYDFLFPSTFTLVIGNEEYGCSKNILSQINLLITIPMRGRKNSLNVANAFSIAAYEITKQRRGSYD